MAAETNTEKRVEDVVKDLQLNSPSKASDSNACEVKDGSSSDATPCVSSGNFTGSSRESEPDQEDFMSEHGMYYPVNECCAYYYPGSSFGQWDDQGYFLGTGGIEVQDPVMQVDCSSPVYYFPGLQPGYMPYSPFLPGAILGVDGQYLVQQPYSPGPIFSKPLLSPRHFSQSVVYGTELIPAYTWGTSLFGDGLHGNGVGGYPTTHLSKSIRPSRNHKFTSSKNSTPLNSAVLDKKGSLPPLDISLTPSADNQPLKPVNKAAAVLSKNALPVDKFPSYSKQGRNSLLHPHSLINIRENSRSWVMTEKHKAGNKTCTFGDPDTLNEQNRGPRTSSPKDNFVTGANPVGSLGAEKNHSSKTLTVKKDHYNLPDFSTKYGHAFFFVIKSYTEDDIHKSIKYNVWASTSNGNRRLDNAYQVAQQKMKENGSKCPVFLFFSVNASGRFCGVAEMLGPVDFSKNMDFWQQDKWNGFFPVKWHIIKDVHNSQFRHIILENNDNKPVTNSRDTQEVKFLQGTEMLNIFKDYSSKTSMLDDFDFYEDQQKAMQDKKIKPFKQSLGHSQSSVDRISSCYDQGRASGERMITINLGRRIPNRTEIPSEGTHSYSQISNH